MRVKKGQLRRWNIPQDDWDGRVFMTVRSRIHRGEDRRAELGWAGASRGEILWTILQEGQLQEDIGQIDIFNLSEAIE